MTDFIFGLISSDIYSKTHYATSVKFVNGPTPFVMVAGRIEYTSTELFPMITLIGLNGNLLKTYGYNTSSDVSFDYADFLYTNSFSSSYIAVCGHKKFSGSTDSITLARL